MRFRRYLNFDYLPNLRFLEEKWSTASLRFSGLKSGNFKSVKYHSEYALCQGINPEVLFSPDVLIIKSGSGISFVSRNLGRSFSSTFFVLDSNILFIVLNSSSLPP